MPMMRDITQAGGPEACLYTGEDASYRHPACDRLRSSPTACDEHQHQISVAHHTVGTDVPRKREQ